MKGLIATWLFFLSGSLLASESVQLRFELDHNTLSQDGWSTKQTVDLPFSVPLILTSDEDVNGFRKRVKVTLKQEPNDMVRVEVEYQKFNDDATHAIHDSTIITKLDEPATLAMGGDAGEDSLRILIHPSKLFAP